MLNHSRPSLHFLHSTIRIIHTGYQFTFMIWRVSLQLLFMSSKIMGFGSSKNSQPFFCHADKSGSFFWRSCLSHRKPICILKVGDIRTRLLKEFEEQFLYQGNSSQYHHEEGYQTQKTFKEECERLIEVINEMGNPFNEVSVEPIKLDSQDIMDNSVVHTVCNIEQLGIDQFNNYQTSVILNRTVSINETIKKFTFTFQVSSA